MRALPMYHAVAGLVPADSEIGKPIPFPNKFLFLHLPPEVRLKIYHYLFHSHLPVYPTILSKNTSGIVSRGELKRTSFPTALLLANRQIHDEATAVLWGSNTIDIQFPLNWNREREQSTLAPVEPRWFASCETFIPPLNHFQQIHHLVIEIHLYRCSSAPTAADFVAEPAQKVRVELTNFVSALNKNGHSLQTLEIRLTSVLSTYNPNELLVSWSPLPIKHYSDTRGNATLPWTSIPVIGCCSNFGRNAFGRKNLGAEELEKLCRMSVDVDQQVLEPLTVLRGVKEVAVMGRVTDDWADFLRTSIESELGVATGSFQHRTVVGWDGLEA